MAALGIPDPPRAADHQAEPDLILSVPSQLRRAGKEIALRIDPRETSPASPNPSLIKLVVRAHLFHSKLIKLGGGKYSQLAKREALNRSRSDPKEKRFVDLPIAWAAQKQLLGIP